MIGLEPLLYSNRRLLNSGKLRIVRKTNMKINSPCYILALLLCASAFGEITYTQTTQMTGGALLKMPFSGRLKQPMETSTLVKGNRMAHVSDRTATIWDLDKETVTNIDYKDKNYSVMTFAEMKAAYEKMLNSMSDAKKEAGKQGDLDVSFDIKVNETGRTMTVSGYAAKEVVMTMITKMMDPKSGQSVDSRMENHLWLSKDVPASKELADFHKRLAMKIGFSSDAVRSIQSNPQVAKAAAAMASKAAALEGFNMMSVTKILASPEMTAQMSQASEALSKARADAGKDVKDSVQDSAEQTAIREAAGKLGKLGGIAGSGLGGLEAAQEAQKAPAQPKAADPDAGVLSELTMTTTSISATADGSKFEVPAGFKKVENKSDRMMMR
jgi:hypothetical protein